MSMISPKKLGLYLRDNFKPCIYFHGGEAIAHGMADVVVVAVFEPEGQQSQCVLQSFLILQRDRPEETYDKREIQSKQKQVNC
jgi:phenylpropionate dioxygenase-like ring-hydroxylating dioxygenase large terminal subunit